MTFEMTEQWWGKTWKFTSANYKAKIQEDPAGNGFYWTVEEDGELIVSGTESSPFTAMGYIRAVINTYSGGRIAA